MRKALQYHFQRQGVPGTGWLAVVLLAGPSLFGQPSVARDLGSSDQRPTTHQFSDSIKIQVLSKFSQQPHDASKIVTIQELHHTVPKKARKEMEAAERARVDHRPDEVIRHLNQAISIDPEFIAARNNLAVFYLMASKPEPAIAQLEQAVKIDPNNSTLFTNLTLGFTMIQQFDAAERAARQTVDLDRTGARARLFLGIVLFDQGKLTEEAVRCFEQAHDEYPLAHLFAARVFVAQGKSGKAKSEIQEYLASGEDTNRAIATGWLGLLDQSEQKSTAVFTR